MQNTATRTAVDSLVARITSRADWSSDARTTSRSVANLLKEQVPSVDLLTPEQRVGDDAGYVRHLLHASERFSVVALVWRPGQHTENHDHIAWCTFVVLQGVEYETLYRDHGDHLSEIGQVANQVGDVSCFAPPGDIHRVHNIGDDTAISLHVYGADLSVSGSSVRREYHLPVR